MYFTKRLIHLYNFAKNSPVRYAVNIKVTDNTEMQILNLISIAHFLLYDKGVCDYINEKIGKFINPANEIQFLTVQQEVMTAIISSHCYSMQKMQEKFLSENNTIESLTMVLITNHEFIDTLMERFKTSNIVEEMILSAKQGYNSAKSTS